MASRLRLWYRILNGTYVAEGDDVHNLDALSRWLIATRSVVFVMTANSVIIGALLAALSGSFSWLLFALTLVGMVLAHATSNLFNDFFDTRHEIDSQPGYLRLSYLPHPILSGMMTSGGLFALGAAHALAVVAIAAYITTIRGPFALVLVAVGLLVAVGYPGGPLPLKKIGLGEPAVFVVWGPLMVGGTFFVLTGVFPAWVLLASVPQAAVVTTVLLGKHIDKLDSDRQIGIGTIPVLLGERRTKFLLKGLIVGAYASIVVLVLSGLLPIWTLLSLLALPRAVHLFGVLSQQRPSGPPEGYKIWPVWYLGYVFGHNRRFGSLFVLGLVVSYLFPVYM